ncbi:MAG TPA: hypothetical protein VFE09_08425, partial [Rubrobacteraceae bacterium]|nr:hypothetical protein [Rubrobacteraceae bacterium]
MYEIEPDRLLLRARGIATFRSVLRSEAGRSFLALLELLAAERLNPTSIADLCTRLWGELAVAPEPLLEDPW